MINCTAPSCFLTILSLERTFISRNWSLRIASVPDLLYRQIKRILHLPLNKFNFNKNLNWQFSSQRFDERNGWRSVTCSVRKPPGTIRKRVQWHFFRKHGSLLAVPPLGLSASGDSTNKPEIAFSRIQHRYRAGVLESSQVSESSNYTKMPNWARTRATVMEKTRSQCCILCSEEEGTVPSISMAVSTGMHQKQAWQLMSDNCLTN